MIYPNRYEKERIKREIYEEAVDLILIYGLPRRYLTYKGLVSKVEMKEIWAIAQKDCSGNSYYNFSN